MTVDELLGLVVEFNASLEELQDCLDFAFDPWVKPCGDDDIAMLATRVAHRANELSEIVALWTAAQDMANGYPK